MARDIEKLVSLCEICNEYMASQQKETLIHYEVPRLPWEILGADLFCIDDATFIIVVDITRIFGRSKLSETTSENIKD